MLRRIFTYLLALAATTAIQAQSVRQARLWVDSDYERHTTVGATGQTVSGQVDMSGITPGVHVLHAQVEDDNGLRGQLQSYFFALTDSKVATYEYWFDQDLEHRKTGTANSEQLSLDIDVAGMGGLHLLNLRVRDRWGSWSSITSTPVVLADSTIAAFECWIDDDYAHRTAGTNSGQELKATIPIDNVGAGMHFVHTRTCDRYGLWSVPQHKIIFLEDSVAAGYEYWLDDDYANRKTAQGEGAQVTISEDISHLGGGVHYFNFRATDRYGGTSRPERYLFVVVDSVATQYEYWLDDDMTTLQTVEGNGQDLAFTMDISRLDIGIHFLNFRCRNTFGESSALHRWLVYVPDDDPVAHRPITGYDYTLNNDTKTVSIEPTLEYEMQAQAFSLPDPMDVGSLTEGCRWTWNHEKQTLRLDRETQQSFSIMFRNKAGRPSSSVGKDFVLTDSITKSISELLLGRAVNYQKLRGGDFEVVRFQVSESGDYYLQSTQRCELQLLRGETLQTTISPDSMVRGQRVALEAGQVYHGLICHTPTDAANPRSTIDVMLKESINKVLTPTIAYEDETVTISCEQEGVSIYYTLDGTMPTSESTRYEGPFQQTLNCTVTAVAVADGLDYSDLATYVIGAYKTETPAISIDGWEVTMSCPTAESTIRYTLDGTTPTAAATAYEGPLTLTRNCLVKAVAMRNGYFDSDVDSLRVDWLQVETPLLAFADSVLTITHPREGVTLHYEIGRDRVPDASSPVYERPLTLERNLPVTVVGLAPDLIGSEMATFTPDTFACKPTDIAYDGRWLRLSTTTREADIHYTLDGTEPTLASPVYDEPLVPTALLTLRTLVTKADVVSSAVTDFDVDYLYDGRLALLRKTQVLSRAFEWCGEEAVETLVVDGPVGSDDWATMRRLPALRTLNLELAQPESQHLPDSALTGARMTWVTTPATLSSAGKGFLANCPLLAAVTWASATLHLPEDAFGQNVNPNLLLYVKGETLAPTTGVQNVVSNLVARSIVLVDSVSPSNFYCPTAFTAIEVSYTHEYNQTTPRGLCQGWETLALPFTVQTVTHEKNGEMLPFIQWTADKPQKPFWLGQLTETGFAAAMEIQANKPYIVAMPNNDYYSDEYILSGRVTFASRNVQIPATDPQPDYMGNIGFVPTFEWLDKDDDRYVMNLYEPYENKAEGSIFLPGYRVAKPFEAYTTSTVAARYIAIDEMGGALVTGIMELPSVERDVVSAYTLTGLFVAKGTRQDLMKRLPAGVYIVGGKKVVVRP